MDGHSTLGIASTLTHHSYDLSSLWQSLVSRVWSVSRNWSKDNSDVIDVAQFIHPLELAVCMVGGIKRVLDVLEYVGTKPIILSSALLSLIGRAEDIQLISPGELALANLSYIEGVMVDGSLDLVEERSRAIYPRGFVGQRRASAVVVVVPYVLKKLFTFRLLRCRCTGIVGVSKQFPKWHRVGK